MGSRETERRWDVIYALKAMFIIFGVLLAVLGVMNALMMNAIMQERWGFGRKTRCRKGWVYMWSCDIIIISVLGIALVVIGIVIR